MLLAQRKAVQLGCRGQEMKVTCNGRAENIHNQQTEQNHHVDSCRSLSDSAPGARVAIREQLERGGGWSPWVH
jgi:hypothetical protein